MSWCFLDSPLYWWLRLWRLRRFLVGCPSCVCRGWEGSLLSFSPWMKFLSLLLLSTGSTMAVCCCCYCWLFFHVMHRGGFYGSKYDSQGHVLDFVQPALIDLGSHSSVVDAYSIVVCTVAVKTLVRTDESAPKVVPASFLIKANFCRLIFSIFSICGFQVSSQPVERNLHRFSPD